MGDYFTTIKERAKAKIPPYGSAEFGKLGDDIRKQLKKKENDFLILIRSLKTLVLGDWGTPEKKRLLLEVKETLLKNGLYAETIDSYYDIGKKDGLSQIQILETCLINHQLIAFIDGDGPGTITEQNYIADNYVFQGKVIFFIEEEKFVALAHKPSEYIKDFPTIITYKGSGLAEAVLVYSRFRLYRLAGIIQRQASRGKGPHGSGYVNWKRRLRTQKR